MLEVSNFLNCSHNSTMDMVCLQQSRQAVHYNPPWMKSLSSVVISMCEKQQFPVFLAVIRF